MTLARGLVLGWLLSACLPGSEVELRALAGLGITTLGGYDREDGGTWGVTRHAGMRMLWSPDPEWAWGMEILAGSTRFPGEAGAERWTAVGLAAEWRPLRVAHLSVGPSDYLTSDPPAVDGNRRHFFGFHTTLGFEPVIYWQKVVPLLAYRTDTVFTHSLTVVRSVSLGLRYNF